MQSEAIKQLSAQSNVNLMQPLAQPMVQPMPQQMTQPIPGQMPGQMPGHPYAMHPSVHQPFIHPGIQPMGYVDPYQQQPIYMPQQPVMVQQLDPQNTVDTNLSDMESGHDALNGREETTSYNRNDSIDPPPSNNDPDPWNMMPLVQASGKYPNYKPAIPPVQHEDKKVKQPRKQEEVQQTQQHSGVPYEAFIAGAMADVKPEAEPSPFAVQRLSLEEGGPKTNVLSKRLAKLRPSSSPNPLLPSSEGEACKELEDESNVADQIIMGDDLLISTISMSRKHAPEEPRQSTSHEDPPLPSATHSASLLSRPDDASFLTYGATIGTETRQSLQMRFSNTNEPK